MSVCVSDLDECESDPCVSGVCVDLPGEYLCECQAGYTGVDCETGKLFFFFFTVCSKGECVMCQTGKLTNCVA